MQKTPIELRESVRWFAEQMEKKLRKHDEDFGNTGWTECGIWYLYKKLEIEIRELRDQITCGWKPGRSGIMDCNNVIYESADVANFAMMIADIARKNAENTD